MRNHTGISLRGLLWDKLVLSCYFQESLSFHIWTIRFLGVNLFELFLWNFFELLVKRILMISIKVWNFTIMLSDGELDYHTEVLGGLMVMHRSLGLYFSSFCFLFIIWTDYSSLTWLQVCWFFFCQFRPTVYCYSEFIVVSLPYTLTLEFLLDYFSVMCIFLLVICVWWDVLMIFFHS